MHSKKNTEVSTLQNRLLESILVMQNDFINRGIYYGWCKDTIENLLFLSESEFGFICELLKKDDGTPYIKSHGITNIAWDKQTRQFYEENKEKGLDFFNLESLWGKAITTGEPVIANDPDNDERRGGYPKDSGHPKLKSFLGLPVKSSEGKVVGVVGVANRPNGYDQEMVKFLSPFINSYGMLIENYRSDQQRKKLEVENEKLISDLKRNQKILKKSKALLDATGRMARVGGWELDADTLELTWTDETYRIHEISLDRKPPLQEAINFFHPQDRPQLEQSIQRALHHGEPYDMEARFITAKGKYLWTRTKCEPEIIGKKTVRLKGTFQDITDRKQAKEALQKSQKDLRKSQRIAHLGSWRLDLTTNQVEWTEELYHMYGFDPALPPPPYTEHMKLFTPESWERLSTSLSKTSETGIPYELELETVREDGSNGWMWVRGETISDAAGKTIGLWGAAQDITERKEAIIKTKESEKRLHTILDQSPFPVAVVDVNDEKILYWSQSAKETFGHNPSTVSEWYELAYPDPEYRSEVIKRWKPFLEKASETKKAQNTGEYRIECKDGITKICELYAQFIPGNLIVTFNDITKRKKAEHALKENEKKLNHIIENSTNLFYSHSADHEITFVSSQVQDVLGYEPEEVMRRWTELATDNPINEEGFRRTEEAIKTGKRQPVYQLELERKDGKKIIVEVRENPVIENGKVASIVGSLADITARKQAEDKLRKSEERLRNLYDDAPVGYFEYDLQGNITRVNRTELKMLGYAAEAMIGQPCWKFIVDEVAREQILDKLSGVRPPAVGLERTYRRKDGTTFPVLFEDRLLLDEDGQIKGIRTAIQDITERKQAETALRESEEKLQTLFSAMTEMVVLHELVFDDNGMPCNYRILDCNQAFCSITNIKKEMAVGKTATQLYNTDLPPYLDVYAKVALSGEPVKFMAYYAQMNKHFSISAVSPRKYFFATITSDITEIKQAEAEREKLQAQLNQAQKMESVGRLAGGVAHDFNNMLGVILGHTELALLQADESHELHDDLKEIQKAAKRSADITKQLLAFARKQTISPRQLDLNDTVESMLNMLRRLIGEDINLIWKPSAHLWPVKMDPSQLDQILANLCINARDAISGVGKLTIETGRKTFDEEYCNKHPGFIPGDFVLLAVSDNGCGMEKDTLANLFEPFFTTKEVGKGTGLGLATIYGIVKQNDGFINVYSEPEKGSTFKIYLPRLIVDGDIDKTVPEKKAAAGGTETILLVEDEPSILRMTRMMLERKGYTVIPAATPAEALEKSKNYSGKIDLLMTDVVMPEMNGRDLAGKVTALYPEIGLLFMSGYTANVIAHHGVLDDGMAFIQKPFSMADMTIKVREVLDSAPDKN